MLEGPDILQMLEQVIRPWITLQQDVIQVRSITGVKSTSSQLEIISKLQLPAQCMEARMNGKELYLLFKHKNRFQGIVYHLGPGAYHSCVNKEDLNYYPFNQLLNILFETQGKSLAVVDVLQYRNFVKWKIVDGIQPAWSLNKGPCIITNKEIWISHVLQLIDKEPNKYSKMTLVSFCFNQRYCNGFGAYTVTEGLWRFYLRTGIKPFMSVTYLFKSKPEHVSTFFNIPALLIEEIKLYSECYNPSNFNHRLNEEFKLYFLQIYQKKTYHTEAIGAFAVPGGNAWNTFYMLVYIIPPNVRRTQTTSKKKRRQEGSITWECGETWYFIKGQGFTKKSLGVGPHDWHSEMSQELLKKFGKSNTKQNELTINKSRKRRTHPQRSKYKQRLIKQQWRCVTKC